VKVESKDDYVALQKDLSHVREWSNKSQMDINKDKCNVLHFGKENKQLTYKFGQWKKKRILVSKSAALAKHTYNVKASKKRKPGAWSAVPKYNQQI
jgi:hypothetical protein